MMDLAIDGIVMRDQEMPRVVERPPLCRYRDGWSCGPGGSSALLPCRTDVDLSQCQVNYDRRSATLTGQ